MKKALIVGLNNYPECKLECCINDAIAIKNLLSLMEMDHQTLMW